ncbi:MAG TPA: DUF4192 domain-containing protein [Actinomycetes bacterium]|nr:DUF4192 domain-containing protein [Actinomycetes bacterium]
MTTASRQTLRIRSQADLVTVIPYLLGFHPEHCLVLIGSRSRHTDDRSFVARIDLPEPKSSKPMDSVAAVLVETAGRARLRTAALVVYAGSEVFPDGGQHFVNNLVDRLTAAGTEVKEAIRVDGARWWGYLCARHGCCAGSGHPIVPPGEPGGSSLIAAQAVAEGWVPLRSRAALAETLRPVSEIVFAAVDQALGDLMERFARQSGDAAGAWRRLRLGTLGLVEELLLKGEAGERVALSPTQAALLLTGLQDRRTRDLCMGWTAGARGRAAVELWTQLVRMAPPPLGAAPATVLAFVAWQRGGGAIVTLAIERALAHDPQDRLARLLADLVFGGVDPADCAPADWLAEVDPAEVRELADEAQEPASDAVAGARCA